MINLITQNPIVALIIAIVPVVAVMWKVFHELYVKPRDFRIDSLKDDMARLNSQLEEFRNLRETRVVTGHADRSSQIEARPTDSKSLENPPMPIAQSILGSGSPADQIAARPTDSKPPDKGPLPITQPTQDSKSPADSLAVFYERWTDPSITKLQKQKFERDWTGKDVRWVVSVESVSEASHGNIAVGVRDGAPEKFTAPRAVCLFSDRDAEMLLSLRPNDPIVVTGNIREFFVCPVLNALTLERV